MSQVAVTTASAQEPVAKPAEKEKSAAKPALPFQIQLLETHIRFEANGDSRKEVHTLVKLNNILGAREFARLTFDYNRAFQQVDIPLVRITHANGGTSELLPSAISDAPNPAVEKFPAYQDVRVKSVRILGLQEGDTVEYRVITTTTHHPLAPDFWLEHTFDRSGQVLEEHYELDLPGKINSTTSLRAGGGYSRDPQVYVAVPWTEYLTPEEGREQRTIFRWNLAPRQEVPAEMSEHGATLPDVLVTNFPDWFQLAERLASQLPAWTKEDRDLADLRLRSLEPALHTATQKLHASYELTSHILATADLPLAANGFRVRTGKEILETGYATPEEKCYLLAQLAKLAGFPAEIVFYGARVAENQLPRPDFQKTFVFIGGEKKSTALDPGVEVAPLGMIPAQFRGKPAMSLSLHSGGDYAYNWAALPEDFPFRARQQVTVTGRLAGDGSLTGKVGYVLRGDNELLLRVAFYHTPKDKWKDIAGLLAISDGFRGQITSVNASDPTTTKDPFRVEYEITQPKFVDWSKTPVRIPALLPQIALPESQAISAAAGQPPHIDLGTPLDVETQLTLQLPSGTKVQTPAGTSVNRDYATFVSKYSATADTLTASRHINFLLREIPSDRAADYNAFLHAVQNDQAQLIVLLPAVESKK
jgi:hypothetical protein